MKKLPVVAAAVATGVALFAVGVWQGARPAGAQTTATGKMLLTGAPGQAMTQVPINQVRASHDNTGRASVLVSASGNGVMSTCLITVGSLADALQLEGRILEPRTSTVQCLGAYTSGSNATNLRTEINLTTNTGTMTLYSNL